MWRMAPESRTRPEREAPELEAMVRRVLASLVRRAGEGDLFSLEALHNLETIAAVSLYQAGKAAHDGPAHYSWTEIAAELGISRQAARQRFGVRDGDDDAR